MPHRVLIVEDDYSTQLLLRTMLESSGIEYRLAESYEEAEFDARWADAAIIDHHLGGRNGLEVLARLQSLHPSIRTVMVTGDDTVRERALAAGADAFICKPFELDDVMAAICKADVVDLTAPVAAASSGDAPVSGASGSWFSSR